MHRWLVVCSISALAACNSNVAVDNPYDPEAPPGLQVKSLISGHVSAEAAFDPATLVMTVEGLTPRGSPVRDAEIVVDETTNPISFSTLVPAGTYLIRAEVPGFRSDERTGILVATGEDQDIGELFLTAGRGSLVGRVVIPDPAGDLPAPLVTEVTLLRLASPITTPTDTSCTEVPAEESVRARLRADGTFEERNLAVGPFVVIASLDGYVPAVVGESVAVAVDEVTDVGTLSLLSGEGVLTLTPPADPDADPAGLATRSTAVTAEVIVPPVYNGMQLSLMPDFGDVTDFVTPAAATAFDLVGGSDGERQVFLRFRSPTCDLSPTFAASVVLDTTAPVASPPVLAGGESCSNDPQVTLAFPGEDPCAVGSCAGLYQMRVSTDGTLDDETFGDYRAEDVIGLPGDGSHDVIVELRDGAGNTSAPATGTVTVNTVGPTPAGAVLTVDDGSGTVRTLSVLLTFDVTGAAEIELGNASGLDGSGWQPLPASQQMSWQLSAGADGLRTVVARFRDDCGNVTQEYPIDVLLDRSGLIQGSVRLEGALDHSGTVVSFWRHDTTAGAYVDTSLTATSSVGGAFALSGLTAGDYQLVFSQAGYTQRILAGILLTEGGTQTLGELILLLARGDLEGSATLQGEDSHDGIVVTAAPGITAITDTAGNYLFNDLPIGDYFVSAAKGASYQAATVGTPATVLEGQLATAPALVLQPVPGSLGGIVERSGQTDHSGIDILLEGQTVGDTKVTDSTVTAADGSFSFSTLTAGIYRLTYSTPQYQSVPREGIVLAPAETIDLGTTVLIKATGSLRAIVDISDRSDESGVAVSLERNNTAVVTALSSPAGVVDFPTVPSDSYTLVARLNGYGIMRVTPVVVSADTLTDLTTPIVLTPQVGDAYLQTPADVILAGATNLTQLQVRGSFPGVDSVRICEDPAIPSTGDPTLFTTAQCDFVPVAFTRLEPDFDPIDLTFTATECPDPGDPVSICDGQKTVWVQMQDGSGLTSAWFPRPIVLDRQAPLGNVVIEPMTTTLSGGLVVGDGQPYTDTITVAVLLAAHEDLSAVASGDAVSGVVTGRLFRDPADANPVLVSLSEGNTTLQGISLSSGSDGDRALYLEVADAAGNLSVTNLASVTCPASRVPALPTDCDAIFLDRTPPPSLAFSVEPLDPAGDLSVGADWASTTTVTLGIDSTLTGLPEDEAVEAILANDSGFIASLAMPLSSPRSLVGWNLTTIDGPKEVFVRVRDRAGNLSAPFSDTIGLDTSPPEIPVLDVMAAVTNDASPTLSFTGGSGAATHRLQLSDSAAFDTSGPTGVFLEVSLTDFDYTAAEDAAGVAIYPLADGLYWWRVQAVDAAGLHSPFTPATRFEVDTVAPAATTLAAVATPTRDATPTLSWAVVPDALRYRVQVASFADFSAGLQVDQFTSQLSFTTSSLGEDVWYARVLTYDAAGNFDDVGAWSPTVSFEVDTTAPADGILASPTNAGTVTSQPVAFTWAPIADAAAYRLEVALNAGFSGATVESGLTTPARSLVLDQGDYWARVITTDAAGNVSLGTTFITFTVDTLAPDVPALNRLPALSSDPRPTLSWSSEAATGAVEYLLQIDGVDQVVTGTSHPLTAAEQLADGSHTWTVAARDAAGNTSAYATVQSFTVDATPPAFPILVPVSPDPGAITQPTFAWAAVGDAVRYEVEWDTNNTFTAGNGPVAPVAVTGTSTLPPSLARGTWFWHVRAEDAAGNQSSWSVVDEFVVDDLAPADANLLTPANGGALTSTSVTFTWGSVADAVTYRLEVSTDAGFTTPQIESGLTATTRALVLGDGSWWARVRAVDAAGNISAGASVNAFSVDSTPPDVPVPTPVASPTIDPTPDLIWSDETSSGAVSYRVDLDGTIVTVPAPAVSYTPGTALVDGPHTFAVAAVDAAGNQSAFSSAQVFEVDATLPPVPVLTAVTPDPRNTQTATLIWSSVADALTYTVQWANNPGFSPLGGSVPVSTPSHPVGPLAEGPWYWQVRATDDAGNQSAFSSASSFDIDLTPPASPAPASPADAATSTSSTVTFTWSSVVDATAYLLDRASAPTFATYDRSEVSGTSLSATLPDGVWYWRVLARDAATNVSTTTSATVRSVEVDTLAPAAPVLTSVSSPTADTTPTLDWSAVASAARYIVTLDGVGTTVTATTYTPGSALTDGTHTWTVAAEDAAGNVGPAAPTEAFVTDSTAPATPVLIAYTPDPTTDNTPTVQWATVGGATEYRVSWGTGGSFPNTATTSDVSLAIGPLTGSPATTWSWRVESLDALGNASAPSAADSFVVDSVTPAAPSPIAPTNASTAVSATVAFSWSAVADATSYRLQVGSDASLTTIVHDLSGLTGTSQSLTLGDGTWYWRPLATDAAGNQTAPASATIWSVTVDANAPSTPSLAMVTTPTNDGTPTFTWSDESSSGAVDYLLRVDGSDVTVAATSYQPSSNLSEGSHTVAVAARDSAGNTSSYSASQTFIVDLSAPSVPGSPLPAAAAADTDGSVDFSWTASTDALTAVSYRLQVAQASDFLSLLVNETPTTNSATVLLADGSYAWRVRAEDAAGNTSAWASATSGQSLTVDTTPPAAPDLVVVGGTVTASPILRWFTQAASGAVSYEVQVDNAPAFSSLDLTGTTSGTSFATSLPDDDWNWRVRAIDAHGNQSAWSTVDAFTLDSTPPSAPGNPTPAAGTSTNNASVAFAWTAPAGGASSYRVEVAYDSSFAAVAWAATTTAPTTTVTISFPDGDYFWRVLALDAVGNESTPAPAATGASFTIDTTAPARPMVVSSPGWIGGAATDYLLAWTDESDSGATSYQYQVSGSAGFGTLETSGSTASTSVTLGSIPTDGTWYWRVRAIDALGNPSSATAGWTTPTSFGVDTVNPTAPGFVAPADAAISSASTVALEWSAASDTNLSNYELQVSQAADFSNQVVVDTSVSGTLSNQTLGDGVYYWRVRAVDLAGNVSSDWSSGAGARTFTVDTTPPSATSLSPLASPTLDARPDLSWSAVSDADEYLVQWDDDPTFASVDVSITMAQNPAPRSYLLDGDYPSDLTDGLWYARVIVTDLAGLSSAPSAALALTIDTTAPATPSACGLVSPTTYANALADPTPEWVWPFVDTAETYSLEIERWVTGSWQPDSTVTGIEGSGNFDVVFSLPSASSLTDGDLYRFRLRAIDAAGNVSGGLLCVTDGSAGTALRSDQSGPISGVSGLIFTTSNPTNGSTATARWAAEEDTTNSGEMGYDLTLLAQDQVTVLETVTVPWSAGFTAGNRSHTFAVTLDGAYYVRVVAWDAAQNESPRSTTLVPLVVDSEAPAGTLSIDGSDPTNASTVDVTLSYSADVTLMKVEVTATIDCDVGTYEAVATSKAGIDISGVSGSAAVSVCFQDAAGNRSQAMDAVVVDRIRPTGTVTIDGANVANFVRTQPIGLTITTTEQPVTMAVSEATSFNCSTATYEAFSSDKSWTLSSGDGSKTIIVCLKDAAGNTSSAPVISDTVNLDTTPPYGAITLNEGPRTEYAWTRNIDIDITDFAADTLQYYLVNEQTPDCAALGSASWISWPPATTAWVLGGGDGQVNTVAMCFRDSAGNVALATDTIVLDLSRPEGTVVIDGDAPYATSTSVSLALSVPSGASEMAVTQTAPSPNCETSAALTWESFATTKSWTLTGGAGLNTVYACFRDSAGRTWEAQDTITLDLADPSITTFTLSGRVGLDCSPPWSDGADCSLDGCTCSGTDSKTLDTVAFLSSPDATQFALANGTQDCDSISAWGTYTPSRFPLQWSLAPGDGTQTVTVCVRDASGRTASSTASLNLDRTKPEAPTGVTVTPGNRAVTVDWTSSVSGSDVDHYELVWSQPSTSLGDTETILSTATSYTLQPPTPPLANCEPVLVRLQVVDAVGNFSSLPNMTAIPVFPPVDMPEEDMRAGYRSLQASWPVTPDVVTYRIFYGPGGAAPDPESQNYAEGPWNNVVLEDGEILPGRVAIYMASLQEGITYTMGLRALDQVTWDEHGIECYSQFGSLASDTTVGLQLDRTSLGTVNNGEFGKTLVAGDLNRDGYDELIVGSPNALRAVDATGAHLYGLVSILDGRTGRRAVDDSGPISPGYRVPNWGQGLAVTTDNDRDGFPELLVGGKGGSVYAFSGRDRRQAWVDEVPPGAVEPGQAIAFAGRATAPFQPLVDVYDEHAVGDPLAANGGIQRGIVRFYSGAKTSPFASSSFSARNYDRLGEFLSPAAYPGGTPTNLMTAVGTGDGNSSFGRVVVFNSTTGTELWPDTIVGTNYATRITGPAPVSTQPASEPGYAWVAVPRVNSDTVEVWRVRASDASRILTLEPALGWIGSGTGFGSALAWTDLNGDGNPDLLIGAPNTSGVYEGEVWGYDVQNQRILLKQDGPLGKDAYGTAGFGSSIVVADVFNDGKSDIVIAAPRFQNAGGLEVGWVGVYQSTDISVSPKDVRVAALGQIDFQASGGTPPYTFSLAAGYPQQTGEPGQPQPSITSDGIYTTGTAVGRDNILLEDSRGRRQLVGVRLIKELSSVTVSHTAGPDDGGNLGSSLGVIEDRNGDGKPELLAGAMAGLTGGFDAGIVHIIDGNTGVILNSIASPALVSGDNFGAAAIGVSDVDADGYRDFLVGAPDASSARGRVYLFSGRNLSLLSALNGDNPGDRFGANLAFLGQWNGQNGDDLAVAAPGGNFVRILEYDIPGARLVEAECQGLTPCSLDLPLNLVDTGAGEEFGLTLATGDVTGDLISELIVGAPGQDGQINGGLVDAGRLIVYAGSWNQTSAGLAILDRRGDRDRMFFGGSATVIADFDDDGRQDILVGAGADSSSGLSAAGSLSILSSLTGTLLYRKLGTLADAQLGFQVAATDLDRDGYPEWVVGTVGNTVTKTGEIQVFDGKTLQIRSLLPGCAGCRLGARLLTGLDANGDGYDDILSASPDYDDFLGSFVPDGRITRHLTQSN